MPIITFGDGTHPGYAEADTTGGASATVNVALTWAQAAGDLILVWVSFAVSAGPLLAAYPQDTSGNVYVPIGTSETDSSNNFTGVLFACLHAKAAAASANTVTVKDTTAGAAGDLLVSVFGWTAPGYIWILDQFSKNRGNSTTATPGAVTTVYPNEVLAAFATVANTVTAGPSSPWNNEPADPNGGMESYYIATTTQSAVNPSYTQTTGVWISVIATFAAIPMVPPAVYPDRVAAIPTSSPDRGFQAWHPRVPPAAPAPTEAYWSYPDRMQQPSRTHLETQFFNPPPVVAARLSDAAPARRYTAYPDRVDLPPSNLRSEFVAPPPPVVAAHLSDAAPRGAKTSYPDSVLRAAAVAQQQAALDLPPLPIPNATAPTLVPSSYPSAVPAPQRPPSDWAPSGFSGSVDDAGVDFVFPDRIDRPATRDSGWTTVVTAPERTQVYIDQDFPDRVRAAAPVAQQQDVATRPLAPERTAPYFPTEYPGQVLGRMLPTAQQRENSGDLPSAPERTATYLDQDFPDRIPRPQPVAQYHQDSAARPLAPERTTPLAAQSYPDRVDGKGLPTGQQQAALDVPPLPITNTAAPTVAYWSYPDQVLRVGGLPTAQQQDGGARNLPPLVYTRNWDLTSYPVAVPGAARPAQVFDATELNPLPRPNSPAPTEGYASYPDRVPGAQRVAQTQDVGARPLAPEMKLPTPYLSFPDRALGAPFPTTEQQHVASLPPKPEEAAPNDWYASFPDLVRGAALPTSQQQAASARPLAPEAPLPSDWRTSYPDAVLGPRQPQFFAATTVGAPPAIPAFFGLSYPERVPGQSLPTTQQQAFAGPTAPPPPPVVPVFVCESVYPDMVLRHPAWTTLMITSAWMPDVAPQPLPAMVVRAILREFVVTGVHLGESIATSIVLGED